MNRRKSDFSEEITLANTKSYIHRLTVRIDDLIFTERSYLISNLLRKGEVFGFVLRYKIPTPSTCNNHVLSNEIIVRSSSYSETDIKFKHKKVFSVDFNNDLINTWEHTPVQITLTAEIARSNEKQDAKIQVLARTTTTLRDLLVPPFKIVRDQSLVSADFEALLSVCFELGSRNPVVHEKLESLKKMSLDSTFNVKEKPARHTRSRSASRCRSCSPGPNNRLINKTKTPLTRNNIPRERFELTPPGIAQPHISPGPLKERQQVASSSSSVGSDSVFGLDTGFDFEDSGQSGALLLQLTLHEAHDLPLVRDESGNLTPPRAFIKILSRNEQIQSTVASPSRNPRWNWTGRFIFSAERGNLVIKMLHSRVDGQVESIGMVTLNRPFQNFHKSTFEITILTPQSHGTATVTLSLNVRSYHEQPTLDLSKARSVSRYGSRNSIDHSNRAQSEQSQSDIIRWTGTSRNPRLILTTRRSRSDSRSPEPREDTSHLLKENLNQLDFLMQPIRYRR